MTRKLWWTRQKFIEGKPQAVGVPEFKANDNSIGDAYCFASRDFGPLLPTNDSRSRRADFSRTPPRLATRFGDRVDYAMLIKTYAQPEDGERRYGSARSG
jgi:hypothetical protein